MEMRTSADLFFKNKISIKDKSESKLKNLNKIFQFLRKKCFEEC